MIGFIADHAGGEIRIDDQEIEERRLVYPRYPPALSLEGEHPDLDWAILCIEDST